MRRFKACLMSILCAAVAVDLTQGESILQQPNLSEPCASELHQPDRVALGVLEFYGDLAGFNAAAGSPPPVTIDFDGIIPGTDVSGATIARVTFNRRTTPIVGAPLIVVRGLDTTTPAGFSGVVNAATNKLFPTSGANVLSPGGTVLGPGPNPLIENDGLEMVFDPPTVAAGFDLLFQELDCCSYTSLTVYDATGAILLFRSSIPTGTIVPGPGDLFPGGALFVGVVSPDATISRIVIDEFDSNDFFPDSNIGFDTLRVTPDCDGPDICDGIDNDCDGTVDGGFDLGEACGAGVGACERDGVTICSADGSDVVCSVVPGMPTPEVYDGLDNDCDEVVDEGLDEDGDGIPDFRDTCSGTPAGIVGVGPNGCPLGEVDGDGDGSTQRVDCDDANPAVHPGAAETCNGRDDDCDGRIDELDDPENEESVCEDDDGADARSQSGSATLIPAAPESELIAVCEAQRGHREAYRQCLTLACRDLVTKRRLALTECEGLVARVGRGALVKRPTD